MIFPYSCYFDSIECESEMGESMHASFTLVFASWKTQCDVKYLVFSFTGLFAFVSVFVGDTIRYDTIGMCRVICVIEGQTGLQIKWVANDI